MKRLIIITAGLLAFICAPAYAGDGHWRGHRGGRVITVVPQATPAVPLIGALLLSQLLQQPQQCCQQAAEPLVFPDDPKPKQFYAPEPKLRRSSPIPMK